MTVRFEPATVALAGIRPARVEVRPDGIAILPPRGGGQLYFIARDRVRTPADALDWLQHVLGKRWARGINYELAQALHEVLVGRRWEPGEIA